MGIIICIEDATKVSMTEANCTWRGQYLLCWFNRGETLKFKEAGRYVDRDMIEREFDQT